MTGGDDGFTDLTLVDWVQNTSPDDFWIWLIVISAGGLACGYGVFYFVRRARIIQDTPTSRIRSAAQGYVELIGQVEYLARQPVSGPLTQTECAWFSYQIEEKRVRYTKNGSRTSWHTIDSKKSERAFQCKDETGVCMIDPRGAEVHSKQRDVWYGNSKWPSSPPGHQSGFFSAGRYRYTEERLHQNEPLYAIGLFRSIDPNTGYGDVNDETRVILKYWKQNQEDLIQRFDANGDGQIDPSEWQSARQAARLQAMDQRLSRADRPAIHILGKTDDFRRPFILSVEPQDGMIRSFRFKAAASTLGFVILVPLAIWLCFVRLST